MRMRRVRHLREVLVATLRPAVPAMQPQPDTAHQPVPVVLEARTCLVVTARAATPLTSRHRWLCGPCQHNFSFWQWLVAALHGCCIDVQSGGQPSHVAVSASPARYPAHTGM